MASHIIDIDRSPPKPPVFDESERFPLILGGGMAASSAEKSVIEGAHSSGHELRSQHLGDKALTNFIEIEPV